jgi:replicative DNA helicase
VILAGRTSMGKSALAVDIALNAAKNGDVVGVFSLEMADVQLGSRVLGRESGVSTKYRCHHLCHLEMSLPSGVGRRAGAEPPA